MRTWVQFFGTLYALGLVGLAMRGVFLPPPWFFLFGAVVFVVPLGYLLTWIGHLLTHSMPEESAWLPWIAIAGGLVLVGLYGQLLAAVPIVFLVFLAVMGLTIWRKRADFVRRAYGSLLMIGLGYASVFALNELCASLTVHTIRDAMLRDMDLAIYQSLFDTPADGAGIFPLIWHPLLLLYLENAYQCMFIGIPLVVFVLHSAGQEPRAFIRALFTCYLVALLIFLVFPTIGPTLADPDLFSKAYAHTQTYATMRQTAVEYLALQGDGALTGLGYFVALPSLHVAVAMLVQVFLYRSRVHFWLFLPINLLVVPATVVLGYHYLLDVPAGVLLACAVLAVPARYRASQTVRQLGAGREELKRK
jgi:membrane-associated phospholipid phosphatase